MSLLSSAPPPHAVWLVLPEVERAIESTLRLRGIRKVDIEDHRQAVLEKALEVERPPVSLGECIGLVQKIARDIAISARRQTVSRSKVDAGLCEDPDQRPAFDVAVDDNLIDARRQLALLARDIESGNVTERQAALLERVVVDDVPQIDAAAQFNLAPQTVRNELSAARRTARASWRAYTAAAAFCGILVIFIHWVTQDRDRPTAPNDFGPDMTHGPRRTPSELAAEELRAQAFEQCDRQEWDECIKSLDRARTYDPAGDRDPRVQDARAAYEKARPR